MGRGRGGGVRERAGGRGCCGDFPAELRAPEIAALAGWAPGGQPHPPLRRARPLPVPISARPAVCRGRPVADHTRGDLAALVGSPTVTAPGGVVAAASRTPISARRPVPDTPPRRRHAPGPPEPRPVALPGKGAGGRWGGGGGRWGGGGGRWGAGGGRWGGGRGRGGRLLCPSRVISALRDASRVNAVLRSITPRPHVRPPTHSAKGIARPRAPAAGLPCEPRTCACPQSAQVESPRPYTCLALMASSANPSIVQHRPFAARSGKEHEATLAGKEGEGDEVRPAGLGVTGLALGSHSKEAGPCSECDNSHWVPCVLDGSCISLKGRAGEEPAISPGSRRVADTQAPGSPSAAIPPPPPQVCISRKRFQKPGSQDPNQTPQYGMRALHAAA